VPEGDDLLFHRPRSSPTWGADREALARRAFAQVGKGAVEGLEEDRERVIEKERYMSVLDEFLGGSDKLVDGKKVKGEPRVKYKRYHEKVRGPKAAGAEPSPPRGGQVVRHGDEVLTGIKELRGIHRGETAVVCCAGTTLASYDDAVAPREWVRFAVNGGIRKLKDRAEYWVFSDDPIVHEYRQDLTPSTTILCMHQATGIVRKYCSHAKRIFTVESMGGKVLDFADGFHFWSRGTVLIGAIEMARWMGFSRMFIFGLDCYRRLTQYHFDGFVPQHASENDFTPEDIRVTSGIAPGTKSDVYVTPRLREMVERIDDIRASGLWNGMELWCVGSPNSQQRAIPKMTAEQFARACSDWRSPSSAPEEEPEGRPEPTAAVPQDDPNDPAALPPALPEAPEEQRGGGQEALGGPPPTPGSTGEPEPLPGPPRPNRRARRARVWSPSQPGEGGEQPVDPPPPTVA
jgi:hypothetical protein